MATLFVTIGSATLAAAFLAFAWAHRKSRGGRGADDSDDAIVGELYVP